MDSGISLGELGKSIVMKKKEKRCIKEAVKNTKYQGGISLVL